MLRLEIKRILKSKMSIIFIALGLILSIFIALSLIRGIQILDRDFNRLYTGIDAIEKMKEITKEHEGDVTLEKLIEANEKYTSIVNEYGGVDNVPEEVYQEKIRPIRIFVNLVGEVTNDEETGFTIPPEERSEEDIRSFYENRDKYIEKELSTKSLRNNPSGLKKALEINNSVKKPFKYQSYMDWIDIAENITLVIFIVAAISIAITCPVFSSEYQSGSDSILRCTKKGRTKLAVTKIISCLLIATILFILCVCVMWGIFISVFGTEGLASSVQISLLSSIAPVTFGQGIAITIVSGLITLLAIVSFTLFISSKCRNPMIALIICFIMLLLPTVLRIFGGENIINWIQLCLPSGGIGLGVGMLYELIIFVKFLTVGSFSFWSPYVLIIAAIIQLPLFFGLAVRGYNKYEV